MLLSDMLRIALDNISPGISTSKQAIGGMRMYLINFIEALLRYSPHEVLLFSPSTFESPFGKDLPRLRHISLSRVPVQPIGRVVYEQIRYASVVRGYAPDVFLGLCNSLPLRLNIPSAVFIKSLQFFYEPESYSWMRRIYLRLIVSASARYANILIVPTNAVKEDLEKTIHVSPKKVRIVPEALYIREPDILRTPKGADLQRRIRGMTGGRSFILCVGATYKYKNLRRLIGAFARLKGKINCEHMLLLIGGEGGESFDDIRRSATDAGVGSEVLCAGRRSFDEIVAAYNMADLFVMPTLYETFGHPVLEAMACGCPVVTSNNGAVAEVAGMGAELVDPMDEESIAAGMSRILCDKEHRARLKEKGRMRASEFSWESTARKANSILEELASSSNAPGQNCRE